ncbi:hypothetical protein [Phocaeicola sartorii]|uniref:hypothetical protein n=1 Tax=Phocaeicola sartorii TaxID=671267 RepID=UPI0013632598|nr:hypothetical protein [Phocaeicola sartorii]NBH67397.1 hypothetical protein [Phocaeicola sartorii]
MINSKYISISFHFCHLLSDSIDEYMQELTNIKEHELLNKLGDFIEKFHIIYPCYKFLICTNSATYIKFVKNMDLKYIYIIPGVPVHIDQTKSTDMTDYMKTFLDSFLISKAEKVFLVKTNKMRNSEFPKVASIIGNKPFELIEI